MKPVPRFTIRRLDHGRLTRHPWMLRDTKRRAFVGQYSTHALAIAAVSAKLREERGVPYLPITDAEILDAMRAKAIA